MKKIVLSVLMLVILATGTVFAEQLDKRWSYLASVNGITSYVDTKTLSYNRADDTVDFYFLEIYTEGKLMGKCKIDFSRNKIILYALKWYVNDKEMTTTVYNEADIFPDSALEKVRDKLSDLVGRTKEKS